MNLFELFGTISIRNEEANKTINETTQSAQNLASAMESSGDRFAKAVSGKVIAKSVALGNILADLGRKFVNLAIDVGKDAITSAANIQAENAQFASSFGELAVAANEAFLSIQKDTNVVTGRLKSVGTKAFNQFTGSGLEATEALEKMDTYMRLVADSAAFYDISLEDADTRMRSFLRGNTEAGDAIGLFTSELQRNTYATEKYGLEWLDLNEAQRQMLMLDIASDIYEQSGAIGQASRESHSWANVLGNLSRTWDEALAKIGGPLMEQLIPRIEKFSTWLSENPEKVEAFANTIGKIAGVTLDGITSAFEWLSNNGDAVVGVIEKIGGALGRVFGFGDGGNVNVADAAAQVEASVSKKTGNNFLGMLSGMITQNSAVNPDAPWLPSISIPVQPTEDSAENIQSGVEEYDISGEADIRASAVSEAMIQGALNGMNLEAEVTLKPKMSKFLALLGIPGFASGIDRVPHDMLAVIHKDETVLKASEAAIYRGEKKTRNNRKSARESTRENEPINVTLNFNGRTGSSYEIAGEVRNALELMRWQS